MRKYHHLLIVQKEFAVAEYYINLDFDMGLADHPSQHQLFFVSGAAYFMNLAEPTGKKPSTSLECGL